MSNLFPFSPADFDATVIAACATAWQKTVDKTLTLALDAYDPELLQTHTLDECKAKLRTVKAGDGDVMVYWQPTDALLGLFCHPRVETGSFPPKVSMNYRLPTAEERAELEELKRAPAHLRPPGPPDGYIDGGGLYR